MDLNPAWERIGGLVGTWRGRGLGTYPTIKEFEYDDELVFSDVGKPFLHFLQRTWLGTAAAHTETGYLRLPRPDHAEFVIAIPTGHGELGEGTVEVAGDGVVTIRTVAEIASACTAKPVERIERTLRLDGDSLSYELSMAAVGQPMSRHLSSELSRA